jgi:hypothetical protein
MMITGRYPLTDDHRFDQRRRAFARLYPIFRVHSDGIKRRMRGYYSAGLPTPGIEDLTRHAHHWLYGVIDDLLPHYDTECWQPDLDPSADFAALALGFCNADSLCNQRGML